MIDFKMNFDFGLNNFGKQAAKYKEIDICGLVEKMKSKKRCFFKIENETGQLAALVKEPPKPNECFKMLSVGGGFSSIAIIQYIAAREGIEEMFVSTFRIGKNHFKVLNTLHAQGKLKTAHLITSGTQARTDQQIKYKGKTYNYFDAISRQSEKNGWTLKVFDNHSKLLLLQTPKNWYVIETSSNLNENPKMEQFSWENDAALFDWYKKLFVELLK